MLIVSLVLLAGAATAFSVPSDAGAASLAVLAALPPGLRTLARRTRTTPALPATLAGAAEPVALARFGGELLDVNDAMVAACGDRGAGGRRIAELLARVVVCDPSLVYRMTRGAAGVGFALHSVGRRGGGTAHLSVTLVDDDALVWRLLDADTLERAVLPSAPEPYEDAPFAYLRVEPSGLIETNDRFRERFAPEVADRLAASAASGATGRMRLVDREGAERAVRLFSNETGEGARAVREIFVFDLDGHESAPVDARDLDELPLAVLHLNDEGRVLWRNTAAARLLGRRAVADAMLGDLVESRMRRIEALVDAVRAEGAIQIDNVSVKGEPAPRPLKLSLSPSRGGDRLIAILSDASELQALQDKYAQSQKMEAIGKLAGGVAHDFNNLITAINGHCDLLMIGKDATQPEYADLMQIRQNANRAAALVRQLLAFSRKQTLNPELLVVGDVIPDTMYLLDRLIGDRIKLRFDPDPGGPVGHVRADHRQLEQALMNLVVNARDAMPEGGTVTISLRRRLFRVEQGREHGVVAPGDYVEIAVADEGTGIAPDALAKVFDPFFTTKAQGEGTGLGLSTVYGIVKQSGGVIFAENRPEGGACFRMLLPRAEPEEAEAPRPERSAETVDLTGRGAVLLVEDEAAVRSFAARALKLRGYDVTIAEEAEEALALIEEGDKHFDLIVSDVMMPGMDGPSFIAKAREMRPGVRVLFVSGYAEAQFLERIEETRYAFLPKPFSLAELTAKVKEVLSEPSQAA
ncbi:MAG: ATP-binding protein [Paracoccaceae bacterium]